MHKEAELFVKEWLVQYGKLITSMLAVVAASSSWFELVDLDFAAIITDKSLGRAKQADAFTTVSNKAWFQSMANHPHVILLQRVNANKVGIKFYLFKLILP